MSRRSLLILSLLGVLGTGVVWVWSYAGHFSASVSVTRNSPIEWSAATDGGHFTLQRSKNLVPSARTLGESAELPAPEWSFLGFSYRKFGQDNEYHHTLQIPLFFVFLLFAVYPTIALIQGLRRDVQSRSATVEDVHPSLGIRAMRAYDLADHEARRYRHDHMGTEHIALGLAIEGTGVASKALKEIGADPRRMRAAFEAVVKPGLSVDPHRELLVGPETKDALRYATEESESVGLDSVATEHLLLGLVHDADSGATQMLRKLGVTPEDVRRAVSQELRRSGVVVAP